jgi:glycosyltransferase involved in cell wall biosynthesis
VQVLYLIPTLERGGAEADVVRLATGLAADFDVTVYSFAGSGPLASSVPADQIILPELASGDLTRNSTRIRAAIFHPRQLASFDIIHAVLPNSYLVAGLLRLLRKQLWRSKLVMTRCGLNWHQAKRVYWWGERILHKTLLSHAVANCHAIARELADEGVPENRISVIHNGIDIDAWRDKMAAPASAKSSFGIPHDTFTITCIGNLWPERKGHADLLAAMKIANLGRPWILLLVGRDQSGYSSELKRTAADMGIAHRVRFLGPRDDIHLVLSAADLHVSASHTEGLPNNVLEAMASGVAVLATDVGGTADLVQDEVTGKLVPPRHPPALGAAIRFLATEDDYRALLALGGLERARSHFSIQAFLQAHASLYRNLADKPMPAPLGLRTQ